MSNGFITISRTLLASDIWSDAYNTALFLYCLMQASHNHFGQLNPGQFYSTITSLMKALGWSRNCIKIHLKQLISMDMISIRRTSSGTVFTVLNWETVSAINYQKYRCQYMTTNDQHMTGESSQYDHYQNDTQNEANTPSQRERDFEIWFKRYPRHERRSAAKEAWMKMTDVPTEVLMLALENAKRSPGWLRNDGRYIPAAVKWLDGNWEDFVEAVESEEPEAWTEY